MAPVGRMYLSTIEMVSGIHKKTNTPITNTRMAPGVYRPTKHDVLCGRGKPIQDHAGNLRMRRIVAKFTDQYISARKHKKQEIVEYVVELVKNSGGVLARFLKRVGRENYWVEVTKAVACDKVSHALRCLVRKSEAGESLDFLEDEGEPSLSSTAPDEQAAAHQQPSVFVGSTSATCAAPSIISPLVQSQIGVLPPRGAFSAPTGAFVQLLATSTATHGAVDLQALAQQLCPTTSQHQRHDTNARTQKLPPIFSQLIASLPVPTMSLAPPSTINPLATNIAELQGQLTLSQELSGLVARERLTKDLLFIASAQQQQQQQQQQQKQLEEATENALVVELLKRAMVAEEQQFQAQQQRALTLALIYVAAADRGLPPSV